MSAWEFGGGGHLSDVGNACKCSDIDEAKGCNGPHTYWAE